MFRMSKRIVNKKLLKEYQDKPCGVCGKYWGQRDAHHHIKQQKGGDDVPENLTTLCRWTCHALIHSTNKSQFLREIRIFPGAELKHLNPQQLWDYLNNLKEK